MLAKIDEHKSRGETHLHVLCENWLANQRFVRVPELALGSATDHGVCWQLASDWDLCAGWQPALSSSRLAHAGAYLEGRQNRSGLGV